MTFTRKFNLHMKLKKTQSFHSQLWKYLETTKHSPRLHIEKKIMTCDALRDLVPFVQFKKREMHPWMSFTFSKVTGFYNFTQTNTPPWVFYTFLNCTNGSKSLKASHIYLNWNSHKKRGILKTLVENQLTFTYSKQQQRHQKKV